MVARAASRARETCNSTTGTGTLSLGGAIDSLHTTLLANIPSGTLVPYFIEAQDSSGEWEEGWGVVTSGSPDTLTRISTSVEYSSNANALVSFTSTNKHVWIGLGAGQWQEMAGLCEGRLTLTSAVPVTSSDVTGASTIYFTPYKGNGLTLFNGTRWKRYTFEQLSLAVPSAIFRVYDRFVYDNSGTLTLEDTAWDSGGQTTYTITAATNAAPVVLTMASNSVSVGDLVGIKSMAGLTSCNDKIFRVQARTGTTITLEGSVGNGAWTSGGTIYVIPASRTTSLAYQNGVLCQNGVLTRRYLGTFMCGATSGQTEDSVTKRLLWNMNNRVLRTLFAQDTTGSWTYGTASYRAANTNTTPGQGCVWLVQGRQEDAVQATYGITAYSTGGIQTVGIGENGTLANAAQWWQATYPQAGNYMPITARFRRIPVRGGLSFYQSLECATSATVTFLGYGTGATQFSSGLNAECWS